MLIFSKSNVHSFPSIPDDSVFFEKFFIFLFYLKYGQVLQRLGKNDDALELYYGYLIKYDGFPKDEIMAERDKALGQMHYDFNWYHLIYSHYNIDFTL